MQASSLGRAEGLDELCSGGGRGRLDGIIDNNSKFIKVEDSASDLDKTSNDDDSLNNSGWGRVGGSNTVFQSINESTPVSVSTNIPSGTAVAHIPWSDSQWGFGSGAYVGAVITGSVSTVGRSSPPTGASGIVVSVVRGECGSLTHSAKLM